MAQRLTSLDASFLHAEDADQHTRLGIGGLAIIDGALPDFDVLTSILGERIAACPRFSQRLRRRIFDLSAPEWVEDEKFSLAHHVRRIAAPAPGTEADLMRVVAEVMSWPLDRDHPLWEIWVIDGFSDDRWAMLMKVHPCLADGVATVHILTGLSDNGVGGAAAGHRYAGSAGGGEQTPRRGVAAVSTAGRPDWRRAVRNLPGFIAGTVAAAQQALHGTGQIAAGVMMGPVSSLNGPVTSRRRYTAARVALDDVRNICRTFDVTATDVALAALTEAYRDMLLRRGEHLHSKSLRTLVPLTARAPGGGRPDAIRRSAILPYLPVSEENPVLRLRIVHGRLASLKVAARSQPGGTAAAARLLPFPVTALATNLLARLPQRTVTAMIVDVPGPRQPLQIMGCDVTEVLPIPPIALQLRTGVAILSYADQLFFGILADYDTVPDADELARGVEKAVARLLVRSKRRQNGRDRHGLRLVVNT